MAIKINRMFDLSLEYADYRADTFSADTQKFWTTVIGLANQRFERGIEVRIAQRRGRFIARCHEDPTIAPRTGRAPRRPRFR